MSELGGTIKYDITVDVTKVYAETMLLQRSLTKTLNLARKLSGSDDLDDLIRIIQRTMMFITQIRIALAALQLALAGAGPIGWFYFGVTAVSAGVSMTDYGGSYG